MQTLSGNTNNLDFLIKLTKEDENLQIENFITKSTSLCLPTALPPFHSLVHLHPVLQTASPRELTHFRMGTV